MYSRHSRAIQKLSYTITILICSVIILYGCLTTKHQFPTEQELFRRMGGYSGVNIHFIEPDQAEVDMLKRSGFKYVRMDLYWDKIEASKGIYDFSAYDKLVSSLSDNDIGIIFILDYGNRLYDDGFAPYTDLGRKAFSKFAQTCARHYKGEKIIWEIWNEPNLDYWKPVPKVEDYTKLALSVIKGIRSVNSEAIIVAPAVSSFPWEYLTYLGEHDVFNQLDAVSVHPYTEENPESVLDSYNKLRKLLDDYCPQRQVPIISGEWGYSTSSKHVDEYIQAQYLVRSHLFNISNNIFINIWYDWRNDGADPENREHNFGTLNNDLSIKLAYAAAKTMNESIEGYTYDKRLATQNESDYILLFKKKDNALLVAWTTDEEHDITLSLKNNNIRVTEMLGQTEETQLVNGKYILNISQAPKYIVLDNS